jgi:hypothetical protein
LSVSSAPTSARRRVDISGESLGSPADDLPTLGSLRRLTSITGLWNLIATTNGHEARPSLSRPAAGDV